MNRFGAMQGIGKGLKIRGDDWPRGQYICMNKEGYIVDEDNVGQNMNQHLDDEWQLYEEPKKVELPERIEGFDGSWANIHRAEKNKDKINEIIAYIKAKENE